VSAPAVVVTARPNTAAAALADAVGMALLSLSYSGRACQLCACHSTRRCCHDEPPWLPPCCAVAPAL
jgi:hypothetical protein